MLHGAEVAVYSEINTKYINTVWAETTIIDVKLVVVSRNQQALKINFKYICSLFPM